MKTKRTLICLAILSTVFFSSKSVANNGVCEIVGGAQYETIDAAIAAVPASSPTTIRLLQAIDRTTTLSIKDSKKITLDLNGHNFNINTPAGTALEVMQSASFVTTGSGALNASGFLYGVYACQGALVNITGNVAATGGYSESYGSPVGVYAFGASGNLVSVTVNGNVSGYKGIYSLSGAEVVVNGNVTAEAEAGNCKFGSYLSISGDVTSTGSCSACIEVVSSTADIGGNITSLSYDSNGIYIGSSATVTVGGTISSVLHGITAQSGNINVAGNVTSTSTTTLYTVSSSNSAQVEIGGNVTGSGDCSVLADTHGKVTVTGKIQSCYTGIRVSQNGEVVAKSDVIADGTFGVGINAYSIGKATIDGAIQANIDFVFGESDGAAVTPTTKVGYLTYSDGAGSYIWVKELPTTFVLTNEAGRLIDDLIWAGFGDFNLYEILEYLKPLSEGVISDEFMERLATCPAGSEIFTVAIYNFAENWPVCINTDGTVSINPIYASDYFDKEGYATKHISPEDYVPQLFTYATSPEYYINAGQMGGIEGLQANETVYYKAFAIAWMKMKAKTPLVETGEILDLKTDSALVLGEVTSNGGLATTQRGIVYATSGEPTLENGIALADAGEGAGEFKVTITGLTPNTTYYARAYATNTQGTSYGVLRRFTTPVAIKDIPVGALPQNLAINRNTNKVYVANNIGNSVTVIDGKTGQTVTTITVGTAPYFAGINETTNKIYVPNSFSNTVSVINGATNTVEATVAVGNAPRAAVVNEKTNKIYVPADYTSNPGKVYVIDGTTNTVENTITVGWRPIAVAVNNATNKIYVANNWGNSVTVIDGATGNTETIPAGNSPRFVAVNDSTNRVYVVNYRDSSVTVIDGKTNRTDTVHLAKNAYPWAAAVNRITNKIYVSNSGTNTVTVIDGKTNSTKNISVGKAPQAIAVNEATNRVYVGNFNADDRSNAGYIITEIDGETDEIVGLACVKSPSELVVNVKDNKTYVINGDQVKSIEEFTPEIAVSPDTLEITTNGGIAAFNISSNISWRILSGQDWLILSDTTGTGNQTITVSASANTPSSERRATITLFMGYDYDTLSVQVVQPREAILTTSTSNLSVAATEGSSATFNVSSNISWTAASNQMWLSVNPANGTGDGTVTVTAEANPTTSNRIATLTVTGNGVSSQTITVTQRAGSATLSISPEVLNVSSANGSTASFSITSNTNWTVSSGESWLTVNPVSGNNSNTILVTAEENLATSERSAIVTISANGAASQTVTVTQIAGEATLSVSNTELTIGPEEGSHVSFSVFSNVSWNISSDQTWITADMPGGTGDGTITLTAIKNETINERTATITVSANAATPQNISVKQEAGSVILTVSPDNLNYENDGGTSVITVVSNTAWTVSADQPWLSVIPEAGINDGTISVFTESFYELSGSVNGTTRTATITVSANDIVTQTVTVVQHCFEHF